MLCDTSHSIENLVARYIHLWSNLFELHTTKTDSTLLSILVLCRKLSHDNTILAQQIRTVLNLPPGGNSFLSQLHSETALVLNFFSYLPMPKYCVEYKATCVCVYVYWQYFDQSVHRKRNASIVIKKGVTFFQDSFPIYHKKKMNEN